MSLPRTPASIIGDNWRDLVRIHGGFASTTLIALAGLLPLFHAALPPLVLLLVVALVLRHRGGSFQWDRSAWTTPLPWAIAFYLLHVLGMLWSDDQAFGWSDLGIKAALLVLPVLFLWLPREVRVGRDMVFLAFCVGCALAVVICVIAMIGRLVAGTELSPEQEVFSSRFALFMHPSYFAWYLSVALGAWCLLPIQRWVPVAVDRAMLAVMCVGVVLCGSKMGWALQVPLLITLLLLRWRDTRVRASLLGLFGIFIVGVAVLLGGSSFARDRIHGVWHAITETEHDPQAHSSSEVRWLTWGTAIELFKADPIKGTGTGDIKDELVRLYNEKGYTGAAELRLNAHQQFLQSAACLGVFGLLFLCAMLVASFFGSGRRDALTVLFLVLAIFNWMVESMLEVQAGVIFFAFMVGIIGWSGASTTNERSSRP
ncbi:MAG: O-antigen ligase family protein [Flavobacteriales bacterium]